MSPWPRGSKQSAEHTDAIVATRAATRAEINAIVDERIAGLDLDRTIVDMAARAWAACFHWQSRRRAKAGAGKGSAGEFRGPTADAILTDAVGFSMRPDSLYARYEKAARRRALVVYGAESPDRVAQRRREAI